MAYRWANITYPYTPSKVDYTASSVGSIQGHSGSISQWHIGNDPLSFTYSTQQSMSLSYQVTSRLKINMTMTPSGTRNWRVYSIVIDNSEVWNSGNQATATGWMTDIGFVVDDANHKAYPMVIDRQGGGGTTTYNIRNLGFSETSYSWMLTFYNEIITAEGLIAPDWHAVNSVSGELGTFEFSKIAQDHINDGNAVTTSDPNYIERFMSQTELLTMVKNLTINTNTIVIYSGSHAPYQPGNYLRLTKSHYQTIPDSIYLAFTNEGVGFFSYEFIPVEGHKYYLSFLIDRSNNYGKLSIIDYATNPITITYNNITMSITEMTSMYRWLLESDDSVIPSVNDEETPEGVNPWTPDDIDPLTAPTISAIDTGFTSMFQVTKTDLQDLSDFLWSDSFLNNVKKFFNDPREIIVGISIMPVAPSVGSDMNIQAGGIDTGIQGKPLTSQYVLMEDIGEVYIQKEKGNFLDYPPYTRVVAHLPFVGEHSLDVNDIMGKTLKLSYLFDFLSGSVVASIKVDGSTNYVFGGCCGMQVPTSSEDFGRLYSSLLSAGATLGTALATVATGGMTAPLAIGAGAAMANNGMNMSPEVQHTSGSGSINGMLGNQSAYITIEIPNEKLADKQNTFIGQMCMIKKKIKQCTGYIKCYKAHLDGLTATQSERDEIESYLMNGFRRETGSTLPSVTPVTSGNTVIMFLKSSSENDVLGKTFDTVNYSKIEGKLVYNQSMLSPKFVITGDVTGYNYAYIPMFNRFYYITDIECNNGNVETVSFKVDALNSFKTQIDEFDVILERQENKVAPLLNDSQYWTKQNKKVIPKYFKGSSGNVKFSRDNNVFILTIAGSNARTP